MQTQFLFTEKHELHEQSVGSDSTFDGSENFLPSVVHDVGSFSEEL